MKKDVAMKWVKALESGKYKQGKGALKVGAKHCCLGVLCDVMGITDNEWEAALGAKARAEAGLRSAFGDHPKFESVAALNDGGASFKKIAKIIATHWEEL